MKKTIGYMVYISHCNALKNKLHKEFYEEMSKIERLFFEDLSVLKKQIKDVVKELNEKHSRCKPIVIYFTDFGKKGDYIGIHSGTGVSCSILSIKSY